MFIEHTKPFVTLVGEIRFLPGVNIIEGADEIALKKNSSFLDNLKNGLFVDVTPKPAPGAPKIHPKAVPEAVKTANISAAAAVKLIQNIFNIPDLQGIMEKDSRKAVQDAAKKQLEKIQAPEEEA